MKNNYYKKKILGYTFTVITLESGLVTLAAPFGGIRYDKKMFDTLVYFNQRVYHGKSVDEVVEKTKKWIKEYKKNNPPIMMLSNLTRYNKATN